MGRRLRDDAVCLRVDCLGVHAGEPADAYGQRFGVSEGLAGQGIAISGAFAVLTSLSISRIAGSMNRKLLLLGLTALMAVSGVVVALAPTI